MHRCIAWRRKPSTPREPGDHVPVLLLRQFEARCRSPQRAGLETTAINALYGHGKRPIPGTLPNRFAWNRPLDRHPGRQRDILRVADEAFQSSLMCAARTAFRLTRLHPVRALAARPLTLSSVHPLRCEPRILAPRRHQALDSPNDGLHRARAAHDGAQYVGQGRALRCRRSRADAPGRRQACRRGAGAPRTHAARSRRTGR